MKKQKRKDSVNKQKQQQHPTYFPGAATRPVIMELLSKKGK